MPRCPGEQLRPESEGSQLEYATPANCKSESLQFCACNGRTDRTRKQSLVPVRFPVNTSPSSSSSSSSSCRLHTVVRYECVSEGELLLDAELSRRGEAERGEEQSTWGSVSPARLRQEE
ncbi:hypothetical protein INR49_002545, partial [Caranx melampygus]